MGWGDAGARASEPEFPDNEGEGREASKNHDPDAPLPPPLRGWTSTATPTPGRRSYPARGARRGLRAKKPGCPAARLRGSSALRTRTMPPGLGAGTVVSAPRVPSAASAPTWKVRSGAADSAAAAAGGGRLPGPTDRRAGWLGSGGTGAACAEPRSPVPTAAVAAVLRLQWSTAPQPLLSHGRGALAGRRSGLPAPGWQALREWNCWRSALPLRSHTLPGTPHGAAGRSAGQAPRLRCAESMCLGSPRARPPVGIPTIQRSPPWRV